MKVNKAMAAWMTLMSPTGWMIAGSLAAVVGSLAAIAGVSFLLTGSIVGNQANQDAHDGLAGQIRNVRSGQEALQNNVRAVQTGQEALQENIRAVQTGQEALQADVRTLVQVISGQQAQPIDDNSGQQAQPTDDN